MSNTVGIRFLIDHILLVSVVSLLSTVYTYAQITPTCISLDLATQPLKIVDEDTTRVKIVVWAADAPQLNVNFQSIKGVRVEFSHRQLSDVTIDLIGPPDVNTRLVGPAIPNGVNNSAIAINHDLTFIAGDGTQAGIMPAIGYNPRWDNRDNPNWGQLSEYTGVHIPFGDQLDNFVVGEILGVWELVIIDHFQNFDGELTAFEIEFGNDLVSCGPCDPKVGTWVSSDTIYQCMGMSTNIIDDYTPGSFDPADYTDQYLFFDKDTDSLEMVSGSPDVSTLPEGEYNVHVLNILNIHLNNPSDSATIFGWTRQTLMDSINTPGSRYCMDLSDAKCLMINDPVILTPAPMPYCQGEMTTFGFEARRDTSFLLEISAGTCEAFDSIVILVDTLVGAFAEDPLIIDCSLSTYDYGADVTSDQSVSYTWYDATYARTLTTDSLIRFTNITTFTSNFNLELRAGVCIDTLPLRVISTSNGVTAKIGGNPLNLDCSTDTVTLLNQIDASFNSQSVIWNKDGTEIARNVSSINVTEPGEYQLVATNDLNCTIDTSVMVTIDNEKPMANIELDTITCSDPTFMASYTSSRNINNGLWKYPDGTEQINTNVLISEPGIYELELLDPTNQCDSTYTFEVIADTMHIAVSDVPTEDTILNCLVPQILVQPTRDDTRIIDEYWIRGVDDTTRSRVWLIDSMSRYTYEVISDNGCRTTRSFTATVDTLVPSYRVMSDGLTCTDTVAEIILTDISSRARITFDHNDVISVTDTSIIVDQPGRLDIMVIDTVNMCTNDQQYDVVQDISVADVLLPDTLMISCGSPGAPLEPDFHGASYDSLFWIFPGGEIREQQREVAIAPGEYYFSVVTPNGCVSTDTVVVVEDAEIPVAQVVDTIHITCSDLSLKAAVTNTSELTNVTWDVGGDIVEGFDLDIIAQVPFVELSFESVANGCDARKIIPVTYDTSGVIVTIDQGTLTCDQLSLTLMPNESIDNLSYLWEGLTISPQTTRSISISSPGEYGLTVRDTTTGCGGYAIVDILEDVDPPQYGVNPPDILSCNISSSTLSVITDLANTVRFINEPGDTVDMTTVIKTDVGLYPFIVTGPNGCSELDTIEVLGDYAGPTFTVEDDILITCGNPNPRVGITPQDPITGVYWTSSAGDTFIDSFTVIDASLESVTAIGVNECETTIPLNVEYSTDIPVAHILGTDTTVCTGEAITVASDVLVSPNHRTIWYRDGLQVDEDVQTIMANISGSYRLEVIDTISQCSSQESVQIAIQSTPLAAFVLDTQAESCLGEMDGQLQLRDIVGGSTPIDVMINGLPVPSPPYAESLPHGTYDLSAIDSLGCTLDTTFTIVEGEEIFVSLSEVPNNIERGTAVDISAMTMGSPMDSIIWSTSDGEIFNTGDLDISVAPSSSELYKVQVFTAYGCESMDSTFLNVFVDIDNISIYVPNVMTADATNDNNVITLRLPEDVLVVNDFMIFDRWGQQVAYLPRLSPEEEVIVWDGTIEGQPVTSGVYVFYYSMTTIYDPFPRHRSGSITVLR